MATTTNGIYYPNDGTKSADILTDLKTMAESIDKNVQKNKYDDTEIKEDISDLQEEQQTQNKNIENLQTNDTNQDQLISKLKQALINVETEESKSLHIEDASTLSAQLSVLGNHEQDEEPTFDNPVEVKCLGNNKNIYDGTTSATNQRLSTGSDGTYAQTGYSISGYIEILPNQYLIINTDYDSYYCFYNAEKQYVSGDSFKSNKRIKSSSDVKYIKFDFKTEDKENIKVEYGSEPTCFSPSGQGSTKISKINKNFFNINKYPFTQSVAYNSSGERIFWSGYCGILDYFPVKENTQYTFSNNLNKPILYGLVFYSEEKQIISAITSNTTTFTTPEKCKYIRFAIQSDTLPTWVQIEIGNTKTSNIEHQQTDYLLYIQQEMLSEDYFVKEADGWKEVHNWDKIIFTGNENWSKSSATIIDRFLLNVSDLTPINNVNKLDIYSNYFKSGVYNNSELGYIWHNGKNLAVNYSDYTTTTLEEFKAKLQELYNAGNPLYAFYKTETSTKLSCTEEQSAVLEELNNLDLFEGVNNIITAEDVALLKLNYIADTKTYIDNKLNTINQQILNIAGGN